MGLFDFLKKKNENDEIDNHDENLEIYENENFEMCVEDVFTISKRGTVVTGQITSGIIHIGDIVYINDSIETEVVAIEMFRRTLDCAHNGDNVGLLLKDVNRNDINRRRYNYKIKL